MPSKSTIVPKFKSDTEEADWYATPQGRRQTQREFARALRTGTATQSAGLKVRKTDLRILQQLMEQAKKSATRAISNSSPGETLSSVDTRSSAARASPNR